jgi:hypothetical protein
MAAPLGFSFLLTQPLRASRMLRAWQTDVLAFVALSRRIGLTMLLRAGWRPYTSPRQPP